MSTSSDKLLEIGSKHVTKGLGRLTEAIITKGEGSYLTLHDGRKMLDFTCGIGVTNLGKLVLLKSLDGLSDNFFSMKATVILRSVKLRQNNV